eukprot:TRINITY_DN1432_c0_g1_i3.p1 TRINITY_DN1432_c0_g1~~TRINITY_DN1432_c0_g1_i3.p1  ORF type:complete len:294 (+),score=83.38 TRINITY_DN1432_c0_g1_i3:333-1214(+)
MLLRIRAGNRLQRKAREMLKSLDLHGGSDKDSLAMWQHFQKELKDMEEERPVLQKEREELLQELERLTAKSDEKAKALSEQSRMRVTTLEKQIEDLKKRQAEHRNLVRAKQHSEELAKSLQDEILRIKQTKVQLQRKWKQEVDQFQAWKMEREKEVMQLRKEGRRTTYEMNKLQALHERQRKVLQRKTEEAAQATKRLKEVLEARQSAKEAAAGFGTTQQMEKNMSAWIEEELALTLGIHEDRGALEREVERRSSLRRELDNVLGEEASSRLQVYYLHFRYKYKREAPGLDEK